MKKQRTHIAKIYMMNVEEEGDYYRKPEGVLFVDNQGEPTLFSNDSRYNFLRSAVQKFSYEDLESGVTFRDQNIQLVDVTAVYADRFALLLDDIPAIIRHIHESSPRQHFFLEKYTRGDLY
jgi:hypothetical protein